MCPTGDDEDEGAGTGGPIINPKRVAILPERLLAFAREEVGVREEGPNTGDRVVWYQSATNQASGEWPWCAAFVARVLATALSDPANERGFATITADLDRWRCRSARAYDWERWAAERGLQILDENAPLRPGDIVTFDFSHIGIVEAESGPHRVITIEGNTNADGSREGDGVYRKNRKRSLIRKVIRLPDEVPR